MVQQNSLSHSVLKQGQIVRGQVSKLFPNNMAKVQLSNQTLVARLEIPLTIGDHYHFQVQIANNLVYLKVIGNKLKNQPKSDISTLLKSLGVKNSEVNRNFMQKLLVENVPFDKLQFVSALDLLNSHKNLDGLERVLIDILKRQLPMSETVIQALHTVQTSQQSKLMGGLLSKLEEQNNFPHLISMLKELTSTHSNDVVESKVKEQFLQHLQRFLTLTGINYEYQVRNQSVFIPSIKGYLLQMLSEKGIQLSYAEKLLHYINGMQLNAMNETESFIYLNLNLPSEKFGFRKDIHLEFNSKKNSKGEIDPDHCRIHFYLELPQLKETMIDMNIQQRNVLLTIYNDTKDLKVKTVDLQKRLKIGLEKINYNLTSIMFRPIMSDDKESIANRYNNSNAIGLNGVDYRI